MEAGTPLKRTGKAGEQRHDKFSVGRLADEKQLNGSLRQQLSEVRTQKGQAEINLQKTKERLKKVGLRNVKLNELLKELGKQASITSDEQREQLKRGRGEDLSTDAGTPLDNAVLVVQRKVMAAQIRELEVRLARFALRTVECDGWCESGVKFRRRIGGLIRDLEEAREQVGDQERMMEWMQQIPR